jgi:effector-binding domain-containing protein
VNSPEYATTPVEIVDVEQRHVAVVHNRVAMAEIPDAQRRSRQALETALKAAGVAPVGPNLTVWRMPEGGLMDYAPGVFIDTPHLGTGEVQSFTLPAGRAAHVRLTGSYAGLPDAWGRLFKGCNGRELSGLNWEIYTSPDGAAETQTDLYALLV